MTTSSLRSSAPSVPDRRRVAAGKSQRRLGALELREPLLEPHVRRERAADQPRRSRADAILIDRQLGRFAQGGLRREAEVIVRGKIDQLLARKFHRRLLRRIDLAQLPQQRVRAQLGEFGFDAVGHGGKCGGAGR